MISHRNVISNTLQFGLAEAEFREGLIEPGTQSAYNDVALGLLPQSHIYSLVAICHAGPYRGDQAIILPKFEMNQFLGAIEKYKIASLFVVCPLSSYRCEAHRTDELVTLGASHHHCNVAKQGSLQQARFKQRTDCIYRCSTPRCRNSRRFTEAVP